MEDKWSGYFLDKFVRGDSISMRDACIILDDEMESRDFKLQCETVQLPLSYMRRLVDWMYSDSQYISIENYDFRLSSLIASGDYDDVASELFAAICEARRGATVKHIKAWRYTADALRADAIAAAKAVLADAAEKKEELPNG